MTATPTDRDRAEAIKLYADVTGALRNHGYGAAYNVLATALATARRNERERAAERCALEAAELRKADLSILTPCARRIHVACIGLAAALAAAIRQPGKEE